MKLALGFVVSILVLEAPQSTAFGQSADDVQKLLALLKDKDISVRQTALRELAKLGPDAVDAVPVLIGSLNADNEEHRQVATAVLGKIGKPAVPALQKALKGEAAMVRRQSVLALAKIGADARP